MRLKQKPQDFRVRELLREGYLRPSGGHRVYRVNKVKLTSVEAARELAYAASVDRSDVSMAGLKDRQGMTEQYMSIPRGREVYHSDASLKIESVGFGDEAINSKDSLGNAFEVVSRGLLEPQLRRLRVGLETVREHGYPNYFDEQRFGNLRHGQGWIALDLLRGDYEGGLKRMMASVSIHEGAESRAFKEKVWRRWGNWRALREIAGSFGKHHSVFDHLRRAPDDFAGAFGRLATRDRVIHQYAFQSHIWNRAVATWLKKFLPEQQRFTLPGIEGPLVFPLGPLPDEPGWQGHLPLPGTQLDGLVDDHQRQLFSYVLDAYGLEPEQFEIADVPGFAFKADMRPLIVQPKNLRARPAEPDRMNEGYQSVKFSFELPRGAYASLLVKRMIGLMPDQEDFGQGSRDSYGRGSSEGGYRRGGAGGQGGRGQGGRGRGSGGRGRGQSDGNSAGFRRGRPSDSRSSFGSGSPRRGGSSRGYRGQGQPGQRGADSHQGFAPDSSRPSDESHGFDFPERTRSGRRGRGGSRRGTHSRRGRPGQGRGRGSDSSQSW